MKRQGYICPGCKLSKKMNRKGKDGAKYKACGNRRCPDFKK